MYFLHQSLRGSGLWKFFPQADDFWTLVRGSVRFLQGGQTTSRLLATLPPQNDARVHNYVVLTNVISAWLIFTAKFLFEGTRHHTSSSALDIGRQSAIALTNKCCHCL